VPSSVTILTASHRVEETIQGLQGTLALDTEFHAEARFFPDLMWIQLADEHGHCVLIDGQVQDAVQATIRALNGRDLLLHAGIHDLKILAQHGEVRPKSLFDTQISAGLLGIRYPFGLSNLAQELLGKTLPKTEAMSDWSQRPIQPQQADYACADVSSLHALRHTLTELNTRRESLPLEDCCSAILKEGMRPVEPSEIWKDFRAAATLDERGREILKRSCMWRYATARAENRRERQICSDGSLIDLAKRKPHTLEELNRPRNVPRKLRGALGESLLQCVEEGLSTPQEACPAPVQLVGNEIECELLLSAWSEHLFRTRGLSPRLLMPAALKRTMAKEWAAGKTPQFRQSWRTEIAQEDLNRFTAGHYRIGPSGLTRR